MHRPCPHAPSCPSPPASLARRLSSETGGSEAAPVADPLRRQERRSRRVGELGDADQVLAEEGGVGAGTAVAGVGAVAADEVVVTLLARERVVAGPAGDG